MPKVISPELKACLAAEYSAGSSIHALAKTHHMSLRNISAALKSDGVVIRGNPEAIARAAFAPRHKLSPEERAEAVSLYEAGWAGSRLAKRYGVSTCQIYHLIRQSAKVWRNRTRIHKLINENAFDNPTESERAAYFAGFIFADGCISRTGNNQQWASLIVAIAEKDRIILDQLRDFLGSDLPITTRQPSEIRNSRSPVCRFALSSRHIAASLGRLNITPRKSNVAVVPHCMVRNRHWWRGCVDGDGWVTLRRGRSEVGLCGSKQSVEQFAEFAESVTGFKPKVGVNGASTHCWRARLHADNAAVLLRVLYEPCEISLPRKSEIARDIIAARSMV